MKCDCVPGWRVSRDAGTDVMLIRALIKEDCLGYVFYNID